MNNTFEIDGNVMKNDEVFANVNLKGIPMFINLPEWIEERNVYRVDTHEQFATIKPKKFGGLTYRVISYDDEFAEIETSNFGLCLVRITEATKLSNYPVYERGNY